MRVRLLQVQPKRVEQLLETAELHDVESLDVDGQAYLSFTEAVPRQIDVTTTVAALLAGEASAPVTVAGSD